MSGSVSLSGEATQPLFADMSKFTQLHTNSFKAALRNGLGNACMSAPCLDEHIYVTMQKVTTTDVDVYYEVRDDFACPQNLHGE